MEKEASDVIDCTRDQSSQPAVYHRRGRDNLQAGARAAVSKKLMGPTVPDWAGRTITRHRYRPPHPAQVCGIARCQLGLL